MAGYDTLGTELLGQLLVWISNFISQYANVVCEDLTRREKLTAFEATFYFYLTGLVTLVPC
jgi:uncharacterized membrane protein